MSFLIDENLSEDLIAALADLFPGSRHVRREGLTGAADRLIWQRASELGLSLVTKDEDFHRLSVLLGPPPKVNWIQVGNCSTRQIVQLLRSKAPGIASFLGSDATAAFLALG